MSVVDERDLKAMLDASDSINVHPNGDVVQEMAKELLFRREEAKKNDAYIEGLEKRLEPCTCQSGRCLQHDD